MPASVADREWRRLSRESAEIGEKLGITHESAKNLVNRLLKDKEKARLFSKQETDRGVIVGVSSEAQDEILEKKYRTTANDST